MTYQYITQLLRTPSAAARGMTRWWWYGCAVTREEIARELDFMHQANIGGVELQILYPVTPDDPEKGIYNIPYGSPEFYDILKFTAVEGQTTAAPPYLPGTVTSPACNPAFTTSEE